MTGVDVAPGIDNRDDGLAEIIPARVSHLRDARVMSERPHVARTEPAMRAQLFGLLARGHAVPTIAGVHAGARSVAGSVRAALSLKV